MNKIQKLMGAIVAIALIVTVAMVNFAFTPSNNSSKGIVDPVPVTYYYKLDTQTGWDDENHYQSSPVTGKTCSSGIVPCRITFDSSQYTLQEYLDTFPNASNLNGEPSTITRPGTI